ncbi:hypothetical protein [Nonomuraea sp. NPDC023979]|uniref:hypothetical protein n=1 Tax=Nonomuraea sp. NPDC023979 TaxID=3154796 RepID=UPI0033ED400A
MNGPAHYRVGERLLASLDIPWEAALDTNLSLEERREACAVYQAQATHALAHFTAAQAAATALTGHGAGYLDDPEIRAWREAAGVADA